MSRLLAIAVLLIASALVAAGCGQYGKRYTGDGGTSAADAADAADATKRVSDESFDDAARKKFGCTDVEEYESEGATHTDRKVDYEANPPHSGDHDPIAAEWGLYDEQQSDLNTVHNLEHGHIVITHKGLSEKDRETLYDQARKNPYHLLVMPRKENPKDGVYYSAWTAQMHCERPSAEALQFMIDEWQDQGPELFTDDPGGMGLTEKDS